MVYIYLDFGVYSRDAKVVEDILRKHNHLTYKKEVYGKHSDILELNVEERCEMTWFRIFRAHRDWIESLYEDLDNCGVPVALQL